MNGFKHIEAPGVLGGHWWAFDNRKWWAIRAAVGEDLGRAKEVCYALGNERWFEDWNELKAFADSVPRKAQEDGNARG